MPLWALPMQASVIPLGTECCGYVFLHEATLLRELDLFLSVPPVPSQGLAQRENQDVSSLPTRTPWKQEMQLESFQGLECQAKERLNQILIVE